MRFSIESRVPFLDHRLVEFLFSLPDHFKIRGTDTKYILRQSLAPILPSAIALRKDKKGFVTPGEVKWLRGPLRFILDQPLTDLPYLKNSKVREIIAQYQNGDNKNARWIWRYFALQDWLLKQ
jgi:asparagine synthase (glutamine-hydrolysing)